MTMNILRKKRANPQINAIYDRQKFMQKVTETIQQFLRLYIAQFRHARAPT